MTLVETVARAIARASEPKQRKRYAEPFWPDADMFEAYFWGAHVPEAEAAIEAHYQWCRDIEKRV